MDARVSSARKARAQHRHELRTLTYVTLDEGNGGIVRNLSSSGIGAQVMVAVRPRQQLRVRFELRYPRLRVEARGEVVWATFSGQCGIRFLDLPAKANREIKEWIFGDLIEGAAQHSRSAEWIFGEPAAQASASDGAEVDDGLIVSATPLKVIELPVRREQPVDDGGLAAATEVPSQLDWLSQPLSGRGLAWTVNTLVVFAALLLFALVFLAVTREAPSWPVPMTGGAAAFVVLMYWGFFRWFGGSSLGARLARLAGSNGGDGEEERDARFR
jgi:hypothetical protein